MYGNDRKKLLILLILKVLEKHSDALHHLTQQEIMRLLEIEYGMKCDRRSVKSNILDLIDLGYDINIDDGYYLASREFDDAELRMMIDSVLFSRHISQRQGKRLIEKLKNQSSKYFQAKITHVRSLPDLSHMNNSHLMVVIDTLNDAIDAKKRVEFSYNIYGTDFKLHPKQKKPYLVSPYQMVANIGRYYLIGNGNKYPDISHYRIDLITNIRITDIPIKPINEVEGMEHGFSLPRHMAEHIYMFCGESVQVEIKTTDSMMTALIDWFGKDFTIVRQDEENIFIRLRCNYNSMYYWAIQYGTSVEVLSPDNLRRELADATKAMCEMYNRKREDDEHET